MTKPRGKSKRVHFGDLSGRTLRRLWGDCEVVDAKENLRLVLRPCDYEGAQPKDYTRCVFARATERMFGSEKVLFFKSCAYVELPPEHGAVGPKRVERFVMPTDMRRLIEAFDRGEPTSPSGSYVLLAPTPSRRFDSQREIAKRLHHAAKQSKAEGNGQGHGRYSKPPMVIDMTVRRGTGQTRSKIRTKAKRCRLAK